MAEFVVLHDFRTAAFMLSAGEIISDLRHDIPALQTAGASVTPFLAPMLPVIEAFQQQAGQGARRDQGSDRDLGTLLSIAGFFGGGPPTGPAGGDLSGLYPAPAVALVGGTAAGVIGAHPTDGTNPHGVTIAQTGGDPAGTPRPPTGAASGQLGDTYPGPSVRGLRETDGPTLLTLGAILDGELLRRIGATLVGHPAELNVVQARRTTAFTLVNGVFGDVTFDTTDLESDSAVLDHQLGVADDRILVGVTGRYRPWFLVGGVQEGTTSIQGRIRINDISVIAGSLCDTGGGSHNQPHDYHMTCEVDVELTAADFLTFQLQKTGAAGSITRADIAFGVIKL